MELVAFLGNDKENWGQITALINHGDWDKIVLVKAKGAAGFPIMTNTKVIEVDTEKPLLEMKREIMDRLKDELGKVFEVALSIASGSGKEHMALISALLSVPVGIRIVVYTKEGIEHIN